MDTRLNPFCLTYVRTLTTRIRVGASRLDAINEGVIALHTHAGLTKLLLETHR